MGGSGNQHAEVIEASQHGQIRVILTLRNLKLPLNLTQIYSLELLIVYIKRVDYYVERGMVRHPSNSLMLERNEHVEMIQGSSMHCILLFCARQTVLMHKQFLACSTLLSMLATSLSCQRLVSHQIYIYNNTQLYIT